MKPVRVSALWSLALVVAAFLAAKAFEIAGLLLLPGMFAVAMVFGESDTSYNGVVASMLLITVSWVVWFAVIFLGNIAWRQLRAVV